jgi:hypothetical protein
MKKETNAMLSKKLIRFAAALVLGGTALIAQAADKAPDIDFSKIQEECVSTHAVRFGPDSEWKKCRLTRTGFVATIGLIDFYYADYCLIKSGTRCERQAQVLYGNRAYRPEASVYMHRIDAAGTRYETPLLTGSDKQSILTTTAYRPGSRQAQRAYFHLATTGWTEIDSAEWKKELPDKLPAGTTARIPAGAQPDPTTMALEMPLYRKGDRVCCASGGRAEVSFAVEGARLAIAGVTVSGRAK